MSTSPQERENLRKRLQKFFQKHDNSKLSTGENSKIKSQHRKKKLNKRNESKPLSKEQAVKTNTSLKKDKKFKNMQKKNPVGSGNLKQNGFDETPSPSISVNKKVKPNLTKLEGFSKNGKPKDAKILQRQSSLAPKTNENTPKKLHSPKQQKHPNQQKKKINKNSKQVNTINKTMESSTEVKNNQTQKSPNTYFNNQQQKNVSKSDKTPVLNSQTHLIGNQKKKPKKRKGSADILKNKTTVSNKKPKLSYNKPNKTSSIATKPKQQLKKECDSSSSQYEDEYDVNGMSGFIRGGDFDSYSEEDNMDHSYWMHEENGDQSDSSSSDYSQVNNNTMEKFKKKSHTDLEKYEPYESFGSEEKKYFDNDNEDDEFDDYYDSDEEENENYSDFDENDYEEDEDSYNYSMDIEDDYSSNYDDYDNNIYDYNENDSDVDYELPEHVAEDLIVQKGTATKRDLKPEDNVSFDSENEETQVVELENQNIIKAIHQPKAYEKEELLKLNNDEITITFHKKETTSSDTEVCPKLVPIVDEDGFQLYNPNEDIDDEVEDDNEIDEEDGDYEEQLYENEYVEEYENDSMDDVSLGSEYEINSDDTDDLLSEDINEKYLKRGHDNSESDSSIDENVWNKKHEVDVIDATGLECGEKANISNDHSDNSLNDNIKQIPLIKLYENVDLKTKSSILSTTIIDNKIFKSNHNIEEESKAKTPKKEKIQKTKTEPETSTAKSLEFQESTKTKSLSKEKIVKQDEDMEELQIKTKAATNQSPKVVKSTGQSLVDFNSKFFNAFDSNLVMVLLKDPFYIYGTLRLTLLAGSVEVYGHSLKLNKEVEIFSPRGCSVIEVSSSNEKLNSSKQHLKQMLQNYNHHFALGDLKTICDLYNTETDAVVLLKRNEFRKKVVQQFKKFMNENVFPNLNNINVDRPLYNTEYILRCMINTSTQEQKCLRLPKQWKQLSVTLKSRVMLTGGKSVGKSTLLRYLINRHLPQEVLLIDLDIGQPEVFIPQTVSCTVVKQPLLGPGFMLNLQPEISYVVGHTNIALCAYKYMAAVRSLIIHCKTQEKYKDIPWIINTMGYNKGFGLELISIIAQELPLTDLIQLQSSKEINNFDSILHSHVLSSVPRIMFSEEYDEGKNVKENFSYRLHVWQSAVEQESRYQKEWEMSAKDMRFAILLARLSEALQGHAEWLTDLKPFSASLNELKIINLMDNTPAATEEDLAQSVIANLVYLCCFEDEHKPIKCLGIGVVRAVDLHVQQLYLIPALPRSQLKEVNCVSLGDMPLPTSLFTNQGSKVKNISPFVYNTVAANASKAIKQIYHRPSKFLTGKYKSLD